MNINEILQPYQPDVNHIPETIGGASRGWDRTTIPDKGVMLLGVSSLEGSTKNIDIVRKELYQLYCSSSKINIVDLGNLISLSKEDQKEAISTILKETSSKYSVLIILAEDQFSWKIYLNHRPDSDKKGISIIDSQFNSIDSNYLLQGAYKHQQYEKWHLIGVQSYYADGKYFNEDQINKYSFLRLGELRDDIKEAEPAFRDASKCILNLRAVRVADNPSNSLHNPNGLYSEELSQLAWYAGNSDVLKSFLITGLQFNNQHQKQCALLVGQAIWYFCLGYEDRKNDNPEKYPNNFKQYHIENNKIPEKLVIFKSIKSSKCWLRYGKSGQFIPCSEKDMDIVLNNDIPNRLLNYLV